jgi:hypothetical protein
MGTKYCQMPPSHSALLAGFVIAAGSLAVLTIGHLPRHLVPEPSGQALQTQAAENMPHDGSGFTATAGTQFNVSNREGNVTVTVTEGSVLFTPSAKDLNGSVRAGTPAAMTPQPIRLEKGQSITYKDPEKRMEARHDPEPRTLR